MARTIQVRVDDAKTLFATHYHELTQLEGEIDGVANYCFTAQEYGEDIVFLRKLIRGEAGQSYGIHVARLAGLPPEVLSYATTLLNSLNASPKTQLERPKVVEPIKVVANPLIKELAEVSIDNLTPIEAMMVLAKFKERAAKG